MEEERGFCIFSLGTDSRRTVAQIQMERNEFDERM
jgi:hypothetical protein